MTEKTQMSRGLKLALMLIFLLVGGVGILVIRLRSGDVPPQPIAGQAPGGDVEQSPVTATTQQAGTNPSANPADLAAAQSAYDEGMAIYNAGDIIKAREVLSKAYILEALPDDQQAKLRGLLEELAQRTIFSREVFKDDPYVFQYTIARGENLQQLERRNALHVPTQLVMKINQIQRPEDLREGQAVKMIYGPFHAVVSKREFVMDIYLERESQPRIFIKRLPVGLGKNGSTPIGMWHVTLSQPALPAHDDIPAQPAKSGKLVKARWDPPPNSGVLYPVEYGAPDYPLGVKGLWISLEGDDENTRLMKNYGIHSTNDPASIGKEGSLGCIRMNDVDIDLVFSLLYEKWSTVRTRL
jgi:hypothetical protein